MAACCLGDIVVIHTFTGGDGSGPYGGLSIVHGGVLYGTTIYGGAHQSGVVFQLQPRGSGWQLKTLFQFPGGSGGANPLAGVAAGPGGALYGTTVAGGTSGNTCNYANLPGCGVVFKLLPPATPPKSPAEDHYGETVLYTFPYRTGDANNPSYGKLTFDSAGNIYGTTFGGGTNDDGTVYELEISQGTYTESVIHNFANDGGGSLPHQEVVFDHAGNLYGTNIDGSGSGANGVVYQLTKSGGIWTENVLYSFQNGSDGRFPIASLVLDSSGNLFGATSSAGANGGGTAFELAQGTFTYSQVYPFNGNGSNFVGPYSSMIMDAAGNLYGTTIVDGQNGFGAVFKLTRSGNSYSYTSLHDFTGGNDGANPVGGLVMDVNGNIFGTASNGGSSSNCAGGCGVVFEITP